MGCLSRIQAVPKRFFDALLSRAGGSSDAALGWPLIKVPRVVTKKPHQKSSKKCTERHFRVRPFSGASWTLEPTPMSVDGEMGRPKKNEDEMRSKWAVLNPTREERATIAAYAAEVGLGVSTYLIACGLRRPPSPRQDWQRILLRQQQLATFLEDIATDIADRTSPLDAGLLLLSLLRIESRIDGLLPHYHQAGRDEEGDAC
jgi:hypothetical protein